MNVGVLTSGLEFVHKYKLTVKEVEIFLFFLEKPYYARELAEKMNIKPVTIHHTLQTLKIKDLIVLADRDYRGANLYSINPRIIKR